MKKLSFWFVLFMTLSVFAYGQSVAAVSGLIRGLQNDTLKFTLVANNITNNRETYNILVKDGRFLHNFETNRPTSVYIKQGNNFIYGLLEQGDDIKIEYSANDPQVTLKFRGKGSEKFTYINSFVQAKLFNAVKERVKSTKANQYPFDSILSFIDSVENSFLKQLELIKPFLSRASYTLLKAEVKGVCHNNKYRSIGMLYHESVEETLKNRTSELTTTSRKALQDLLIFDSSFYTSDSYVNAVYNILFMHYDALVVANKKSNNLLEKYAYLNTLLPASLKAPVLTLFFEYDISKMNQAEHLATLIQQTYVSAADSMYKSYISQQLEEATTFRKGAEVPDFSVENDKGEKVSLSSFRGKVIYIDFWYEACGPCHALFKSIKPVKERFKGNSDVVFLNISIDKYETWQRALKRFVIEGYHAYTENKEADHDIIRAYKVTSYPTTCIIDKQGKLFTANPSNNPDVLLKQLEEALNQ